MESVKERFRDDVVGGVRLGEDSSCKRERTWGQYIGEQRRNNITLLDRLLTSGDSAVVQSVR